MLSPVKYIRDRFFRKPLPPREAFRLFKEVLDQNNRALEAITGMGENLGGDYLFDINYVKEAHARLSEAVDLSITRFDSLTQGAYPGIREAFARVEGQIGDAISDSSRGPALPVMSFDDLTWENAREAGLKNTNLAEIKNRLGLDVPDGFAITTHAFDEFINHNSLRAAINEACAGEPDEERLARLRKMIESAEVPPAPLSAIDEAIKDIKARHKGDCFLAVRSSAQEEDGEFSFAGQFLSILNVPALPAAVIDAYKKVVASLFAAGPIAYQRRLGYDAGNMKMAVGCVVMVDAAASGVTYTVDPDGDSKTMLVNAAWGLGSLVVEGRADADTYVVAKPVEGGEPEIIDTKAGHKTDMVVRMHDGGTETVSVEDGLRNLPCLTKNEVSMLSQGAMLIERHFRQAMDIEWALGRDGKIYFLQARPLKIHGAGAEAPDAVIPQSVRVLMKERGAIVQKGAAAGNVFIVRHDGDLERIPDGAVLVSTTDSSKFVRVMTRISAIITDTGTQTSHMASLCREFRVPTVVNTGIATKTLKQGGLVTLNADDKGFAVYEGVLGELVRHAKSRTMGMEAVYEYRKKRLILRYISPLNLVDPLQGNFTPEGCRTIHDVIRFVHEKSVAELVENARQSAAGTKGASVKLELPIPAGIIVIDIGGGLTGMAKGARAAGLEQVSSVPLKAIIRGMTHPGVWHSDTVSLKAGDFFSSMVRMSDITADAGSYVGYNVAVASNDYVNLSLRFGYHFNMLDCYMSENARNNHIYFRFAGGATEITKRSRRVQLISTVLNEFGFSLKVQGDLIIARLANIGADKMEGILDQLGRLISYTRQLDALMNTDGDVSRYAKNFMEENFK